MSLKNVAVFFVSLALISACSALDNSSSGDKPSTVIITGIEGGGVPTPTPTPHEESCRIVEAQPGEGVLNIAAEWTGTGLQLIDNTGRTPATLLTADTRAPLISYLPAGLNAEVTTVPVAGGADVHIVFQNPTQAAIALDRGDGQGIFELNGFDWGRTVTAYDIRNGTEPYTVDRQNQSHLPTWPAGSWNGAAYTWPGDLYSPVALLKNDRYNLGVSLLYNVMEYRHRVSIQMRSFTNNPHWSFNFRMYGEVPAGATREYVVAVRITPASENLMKVLVPYRNFFHDTYGGVQYTRNPNPMYVEVTAQGHMCSEANPYCFTYTTTRRPDVFGWGPWADYLKTVPAMGYRRGMMWTASGMTPGGPNYSSMFMTPMLAVPAMANSMDELRSIPTDNFEFGYYWGLADNIMYGDYPSVTPQRAEPLNIHNPEHVRRALAEFDIAVNLGATWIGLDAFPLNLPSWEGLEWLHILHDRAPQVRFGCELTPSDIVHTFCASTVFSHYVTRENLLADFILPGHESWSIIRYDVLRPHHDWTVEERRAVISEVAALGYVALPTWGTPLDQPYAAAESWMRTLPEELRPCVRAQNL